MKKFLFFYLTLIIFSLILAWFFIKSFIPISPPEEHPQPVIEIKGPKFAEVNKTISFLVTSNGVPIEGASVTLAGYKKKTNKEGIAHFQIDFAGVFKAKVEKEGYKTNSTLFWIFPRGNEKFQIRSTKSASDPQQVGNTIAAFRMAGFNYARLKAYFAYDKDGHIYSTYPWVGAPFDVQLESLAWMISRSRDWGFKIFLQSQLFYINPITGKEEDPNELLEGKAKETFYRERIRYSLMLAKFAEEQKVEIFEPFRHFLLMPPEDYIQLYEELLPQLRETYSGKIVLSSDILNMPDLYSPKLEGILRGFDYLEVLAPRTHPLSPTPTQWKGAIHRCIEVVYNLRDRYGIEPLFLYIGNIDKIRGAYASDDAFREFMDNFGSTEQARIWFINTTFTELLDRSAVGVDVHPLWFWEMNYPIYDHEIRMQFSYWPSKKLLNVASSQLVEPWNVKGKKTYNLLKHTERAVEVIKARTDNQALIDWASKLLEESYKKYVEKNYEVAIKYSHEILGFLTQVANPLGITVDGYASEWRSMDPIYFNLDQKPRWFNQILKGKYSEVKDWGNLKAVYAMNDNKYLYLMLEFYGRPPRQMPSIEIDISGEWTHQRGMEFHVEDACYLYEVKYSGLNWIENNRLIASLDCAVNDVVELKIPLNLLRNPTEINLIVWYPDIAPWGDMQINLIDWKLFPTNPISIGISN